MEEEIAEMRIINKFRI